jgi:regulator of RNase E activity RraA
MSNKKSDYSKLLTAFSRVGIYAVADAVTALGVGGVIDCLRPMTAAARFLAPAFAVRFAAGADGAGYRTGELVDATPQGSVLVLEAGGIDRSVIGDMVVYAAARSQLGGLIVNGAIRDVDTLATHNLPVFAMRGAMRSALHRIHVDEIDCRVEVAGVTISPGDLVFGDTPGLVVVPLGAVHEVVAIANTARERDDATFAALSGDESVTEIWRRIRKR